LLLRRNRGGRRKEGNEKTESSPKLDLQQSEKGEIVGVTSFRGHKRKGDPPKYLLKKVRRADDSWSVCGGSTNRIIQRESSIIGSVQRKSERHRVQTRKGPAYAAVRRRRKGGEREQRRGHDGAQNVGRSKVSLCD